MTARLVGDMAARAPPSSGRLRAVLAAAGPPAPATVKIYMRFVAKSVPSFIIRAGILKLKAF